MDTRREIIEAAAEVSALLGLRVIVLHETAFHGLLGFDVVGRDGREVTLP